MWGDMHVMAAIGLAVQKSAGTSVVKCSRIG